MLVRKSEVEDLIYIILYLLYHKNQEWICKLMFTRKLNRFKLKCIVDEVLHLMEHVK